MFNEACKSILLSLVNVDDPSKEPAFNEFYENVHIPDMLGTPGILGVQRFVCIDENMGKGKYLTILEFSPLDAQIILGQVRATISEKQKAPGHSFAGVTPTLTGVFRRFLRLEDQTRPQKNITGLFLAFFSPNDVANLAEMHLWQNTVHVPDLLNVPGFHAVNRLEAADLAAGYQFLNIYEIDSEVPKASLQEMRQRVSSWRAAGRLRNIVGKQFSVLFQRQMPFRISVVG